MREGRFANEAEIAEMEKDLDAMVCKKCPPGSFCESCLDARGEASYREEDFEPADIFFDWDR